jgi:hypothetical protein
MAAGRGFLLCKVIALPLGDPANLAAGFGQY